MLNLFDQATNVQSIDNVQSVRWRVFGIGAESSRDSTENPLSSFQRLEEGCHKIMQTGLFAFHDVAASQIWAFITPSHDVHLNDSWETLLATLHDASILELKSGKMHAPDPGGTSRHQMQANNIRPHQVPITSHTGKNSTDQLQASGMPPTSRDPPSDRNNRHETHDAFLSAIIDTLVYNMTAKSLMIPLCYNTIAHNPDDCYEEMFDDPWPQPATPEEFAGGQRIRSWRSTRVGTEWSAEGKLMLSIWSEHITYFSLRDFEVDPQISDHHDAVIAPLGIKVALSQVVWHNHSGTSASDDLPKKVQQERQAVLPFLRGRGISLRDSTRWCTVILRQQTTDDNKADRYRSIAWPSELIFFTRSTGSFDKKPRLVNFSNFRDPFQVASTLNELELANVMAEDKQHLTEEGGFETVSDAYARILENSMYVGGAGMMYSTPPEVTRSQGLQQRERHEFSAPTPATMSSGPVYGQDEGDPFPPDQHHMLVTSADGIDHDDLFADLSMELGDDVLNEDEFGFFDASKAGNLDLQTQSIPVEADGDEQNVLNNVMPHAKEKSVSFEAHFPDANDSGGDLITATVHRASDDPIRLSADPARRDDLFPISSLSGNRTLSMTVVSRISRPLDDKYRNGGLFGVSTPHVPATMGPHAELPSGRSIPTIAVSDKDLILTKSSSNTSLSSEFSEDSGSDDSMGEDNDEMSVEKVDEVIADLAEPSSNPSRRQDATINVPLIDLVSSRVPLTALNVGPNEDQSRKLAQYLRLDDQQFMDLSRLVEDQLACWPDAIEDVCPTETQIAGHRSSDEERPAVRRTSASKVFSPCCRTEWNSQQHSAKLECDVIRSAPSKVLSHLISTLFPDMQNMNVGAFVDLENGADIKRSAILERTAQQIPEANQRTLSDPMKPLDTPEVVIRREDVATVVSATALSFWAELGLSPIDMQHAVTAYCFVPGADFWIRGAELLLESLDQAFRELRLGVHTAGKHSAGGNPGPSGIITIDDAGDSETYFSRIHQILQELGRKLQEETTAEVIGIYIVTTEGNSNDMPLFCTAFQRFQQLLHDSGGNKRRLILKVLPRPSIVRDFHFGFQSHAATRLLAWEIYDRCCQCQQQTSAKSLLYLATPTPRSINLHLKPNCYRKPFDCELVTHVAYSWAPGNPWLSFAYCDNVGQRRWHSSYYVSWETAKQTHEQSEQIHGSLQTSQSRRPLPSGYTSTSGGSSTTSSGSGLPQRFVGVACDVLASLLEISEDLVIPGQPCTHHVILVKDGPMTRHEELVWRSLTEKCAKPGGVASILTASGQLPEGRSGVAKSYAQNVTVNFTIAILDPECPLELTSLHSWVDSFDFNHGYNVQSYTQDLPASTPGTPSLASPGFSSPGFPGSTSGPMSVSWGRDADDRSARLVTYNSLAWWCPTRSVLSRNYTGKLEILSSPEAGPGLGKASQRLTAMSGCGYLILHGDDIGSDNGDINSNYARPRVLSLRIVAAKAPSLMSLHDLAQVYRDLTTIANVFGLGKALPWHVAMARKSRTGLGRCM